MFRRHATVSAIAIIAALLVGFILAAVMTSGIGQAWDAFHAMAIGGLGNWSDAFESHDSLRVLRPLGETSLKTTLLLLTGLSVAIPFRMGLFNVGAQGQLLWGAVAAAWVGVWPGLGSIHWVIALLFSGIIGGLYGLIPAILKVHRHIHEVIVTIMLNWIAVGLIENWLVVGPLKATATGDNSISGTAQIANSAQLPTFIANTHFNIGLPISLVLCVVTGFVFYRWVIGYEWNVIGHNPNAAWANGIQTASRTYLAFGSAGALAGLAGGVLILGSELHYPTTIAAAYGFDGVAMAMLGQSNPLGIAAVSFIFGALRAGGTRMQLFGVHKSFPELMQGMALLFVSIGAAWQQLKKRTGAHD